MSVQQITVPVPPNPPVSMQQTLVPVQQNIVPVQQIFSPIRLCLKGLLLGSKVMDGLDRPSEGLGSSGKVGEASSKPPELGSLGFQGWFPGPRS